MGKLKDGLKKNKYEIIKKQNKIADEQKNYVYISEKQMEKRCKIYLF